MSGPSVGFSVLQINQPKSAKTLWRGSILSPTANQGWEVANEDAEGVAGVHVRTGELITGERRQLNSFTAYLRTCARAPSHSVLS